MNVNKITNHITSSMTLIAIVFLMSCGSNKASESKEDSKDMKTEGKTEGKTEAKVVSTEENKPNPDTDAKFEFDAVEYDFGDIKDGEVVEHTFKFKNVGKSPLVIESTTATCGCTVPEHTKVPVQPGGEGIIKVAFNSSGKVGVQNKAITITANSYPRINKLYIKGEVKAVPKGSNGPNK